MISSRQSTFRRIKKPEICCGWVHTGWRAQHMHGCTISVTAPPPIVLMPSSLQAKKTQRQQQCDRLRPPHAHTGEEIWQRFTSQHVPVTHTGSPQDKRGASGRKSGNQWINWVCLRNKPSYECGGFSFCFFQRTVCVSTTRVCGGVGAVHGSTDAGVDSYVAFPGALAWTWASHE